MPIKQIGLNYLEKMKVLSKHDIFEMLKKEGYTNKESSFLVEFQQMINDGAVQRVGRNSYCFIDNPLHQYTHEYSDVSLRIADYMQENYPYADFVIFETIQLNEFINHQIGKNTIFVFVENEITEYVFDALKDVFPNQVMISPGIKEFHQYRNENTIIVTRLVSESPKNRHVKWYSSLEKILVDIMADNLVKETFSESEYRSIYENAFSNYTIDESKMFRYARRRNASARIRDFIKNNTSVKLKLEEKKK